MRVNVYAEEMTSRVEIVEKNGFTGLRVYLELPVTIPGCVSPGEAYAAGYGDGAAKYVSQEAVHRNEVQQVKGPFLHHEGDDDSSAVTFWGKRDMREVVAIMKLRLDDHYKTPTDNMFEQQARAWLACYDQMRLGNRYIAGRGATGLESAVMEIERLQKSDTDLQVAVQEITRLKERVEQLETGAR